MHEGDPAATAPVAAPGSRTTTWIVWLVETLALVAIEIALRRAFGPFCPRRRC